MKDEFMNDLFELKEHLLQFEAQVDRLLMGYYRAREVQEVEDDVEIIHTPKKVEQKPVPKPPKPTEAPKEQKKKKGIFKGVLRKNKPENGLESVRAKEQSYEEARKRLMAEIDKELQDIRGKDVSA